MSRASAILLSELEPILPRYEELVLLYGEVERRNATSLRRYFYCGTLSTYYNCLS